MSHYKVPSSRSLIQITALNWIWLDRLLWQGIQLPLLLHHHQIDMMIIWYSDNAGLSSKIYSISCSLEPKNMRYLKDTKRNSYLYCLYIIMVACTVWGEKWWPLNNILFQKMSILIYYAQSCVYFAISISKFTTICNRNYIPILPKSFSVFMLNAFISLQQKLIFKSTLTMCSV
jgi:hypothetical protein